MKLDKMGENSFLKKLYRTDKVLFAALCLYVLGVLYYAAHQREEFPFLLYGMYSLREEPRQTYFAYSIEIAGQEIKYVKLRNTQRELINSTLDHAMPLIENHQMSDDDKLKLEKWLMAYCGDVRLTGQNKMDIYKLTCNYTDKGKVQVLKKDLVLSYATD